MVGNSRSDVHQVFRRAVNVDIVIRVGVIVVASLAPLVAVVDSDLLQDRSFAAAGFGHDDRCRMSIIVVSGRRKNRNHRYKLLDGDGVGEVYFSHGLFPFVVK